MTLTPTDDESTLARVMAWCWRRHTITWTSADQDLRRHMASISHNELMHGEQYKHDIFNYILLKENILS